jgi:hypothetical protein
MMFLSFAGVTTTFGTVLSTFGINISSTTNEITGSDTALSSFFIKVTAILALAATAGIVIGTFTKTYDTSLIIVGLCSYIAYLFASTGYELIQIAQGTGEQWIVALVSIIFIPSVILFIFSCVDYFAGR